MKAFKVSFELTDGTKVTRVIHAYDERDVESIISAHYGLRLKPFTMTCEPIGDAE